VGQRGLAQARRAIDQHVVQRFAPHLGRLEENAQVFFDAILTNVFVQGLRAQADVEPSLFRGTLRRHDPVSHI